MIKNILDHGKLFRRYSWVVTLWALYALLYLAAPNSSQYGLSLVQIYVIKISILLPVLVIWLLAARGYKRLKKYAEAIKEHPDGKALQLISRSILLLLTYVMVQFIASAMVPYFRETDYLPLAVFLQNHTPLVLAFAGSVYMLLGSMRLAAMSPKTKYRLTRQLVVIALYLVISAIASWYFYQNIQTRFDLSGIPNFALPGALPLFTYALPYLLTWLLGIMSAIHILTYAFYAKGVIYMRPLQKLAGGILVILFTSFLIQLFLMTIRVVPGIPLQYVLLPVYGLQALYALGFALVHSGAKRLHLIETAGSKA